MDSRLEVEDDLVERAENKAEMIGRYAEEEEEEEQVSGMPHKSLDESHMDHLQDEMKKLLQSSSTNERDAVRSWLKSERCLGALSQLQSISARIDDLRRLNPGLDHELKLMLRSSKHESDSVEEERLFAARRGMWELINANKFEELSEHTFSCSCCMCYYLCSTNNSALNSMSIITST